MKNKSNHFLKAGITIKIISIFFAITMLLSTIPMLAGAIETNEIIIDFNIEEPELIDNGEFVKLQIGDLESRNGLFGAPDLAVIRGAEWLPEGAQEINANLIYSSVETGVLPKPISPSPVPAALALPGSKDNNIKPETYEYIYNSYEQFGIFLDYQVGYGINPEGIRSPVITYEITPLCLTNPADGEYKYISGDAHLEITYETSSSPLSLDDEESEEYDLLILSANAYISDLQRLVNHKEDMGISTKLVSLNEIYAGEYFEIPEDCQYQRDNQEKIKYFIYNAINEWDITYCMVVGGFRSFWGLNRENVQFPMRYRVDIRQAEPGYGCELYYSTCIGEDEKFDSWDSNENDIIGEIQDQYDRFSDVYFGRLACRNRMEMKNVIDKIITYETITYGEEWFNSFMTVGGDGFQDMGRLLDNNVSWDTSSLPNGNYKIFAQSEHPYTGLKGPIDVVNVTIDKTAETRVTFHEYDHLSQYLEPLVENQDNLYPCKPVAHIVVPSEGDILGYGGASLPDNPEAYCSDFWHWGDIKYANKVLDIKIKSYDPSPKSQIQPKDRFASKTAFSIWIENSAGDVVFTDSGGQEIYYENEMGNQKAHNFLPDFEQLKLWTSNGNSNNMWDVIDAFSEGHGFVFINGHSSCMSWMDHYPGIPGGRSNGGFAGIAAINMRFGLERYAKGEGDPLFPIDQLYNGYKLPVFLFSGCHSGQFDTSFMRLFTSPYQALFGPDLYNTWSPEGMAWWITRIPQGGSIATIGNTALGYGYFGEACVDGLGGWLYPEFFNTYSRGYDMLGEVFTQTTINFTKDAPMGYDQRTHEIWVLLGDPSLKIGGYPPSTRALEETEDEIIIIGDIVTLTGQIQTNLTNDAGYDLTYVDWVIKIEGVSPLAEYFGVQGTIFERLLGGRVMQNGYAADNIGKLERDETLEISSGPIFGFGHIMVNITATQDDIVLGEKTEDGFLLGGRLFLTHEEE